jgi:membrane fusion protein YbhG
MPRCATLLHRVTMRRAGLATAIVFLPAACLLLGCNNNSGHRYGGYVEAEKIEVGSRVGGRIEKVFVEEGSEVKKGDLLVQFEKVHLEAQLEEARQRAGRLQAALDKAVAGPRPQEIAVAKQNYEAAVAQAKRADDDYKRGIETGVRVITGEKLEELETAMKVAKSEEQARRQELNMLEEGTRAEDVIIARRQLEETQAQVLFAEDQLREAEVRAPVDAIVEVCDLQPGDLVAAGVPLATLVRMDELWVRCFVPTAQLTLVHAGQKVKVTVDSRPDKTFEGEVLRVNRVAEYTPRNVQTYEKRQDQVFGVKVRVRDADNALRPGMAATVEIAE